MDTTVIDDTQLERTVPGLVERFRRRLAERVGPIDAALADDNYRHAGRRLCSTVRSHAICHTDDEHDALARIEAYLYDTQGPRD